MRILKALLTGSSGASAVEYGLLAALISLAMTAALISLGNGIDNTFQMIAGYMTVQ